MHHFLHQNQGKISFKAAIFGLALVLVLGTSGMSFIKLVRKATDNRELMTDLPIVFAAHQTPSLIIDLDRAGLDTAVILANSIIDIIGPRDVSAKENFEMTLASVEKEEYELKIKSKKPTFRPGRYQVSARFVTPQGVRDYSQDFYWGVLALNTNKSVYLPYEQAYLQMAVLDDKGDTICDADLRLKVKSENLKIEQVLSTQDGTIVRNPQCGPNNVIDTPDYYAYYQLGGPGVYQLELVAETVNGPRAMQDFIEVKEFAPFEVERIGPTRIYPLADYQMKFNIKANQDFQGQVIEIVPADFEVAYYSWSEMTEGRKVEEQTVISMSSKATSPNNNSSSSSNSKQVIWPVNWQAGQIYQLSYTFDASDISPEFYLLGPLTIGGWQEARHWQIAADTIDAYIYTPSTACTDPDPAHWTSVGNACDAAQYDDTWASRDVPGAEDDPSTHILADANNAPSGDGIISVVEIGVECHTEKNVNSTIHLIPVFGGITDGNGVYNFLNINTIDDDVTQYFVITDDTNGPGTWSWSTTRSITHRALIQSLIVLTQLVLARQLLFRLIGLILMVVASKLRPRFVKLIH